jgi:hypothetical protein
MRNPEDLLSGPCNPKPHPDQLKVYEPAERQRRMLGNDVENNLGFFAVGLIYVAVGAGSAAVLQHYTWSKVLHHFVYWPGQRHEVRATFWTYKSATFLYMCYLGLEKVMQN